MKRPSHATVSHVSINSEPCATRSKCLPAPPERCCKRVFACVCVYVRSLVRTPVAINITLCSGFQRWDSTTLIPASPSLQGLEYIQCWEVRGVSLIFRLLIPMATLDWVAAPLREKVHMCVSLGGRSPCSHVDRATVRMVYSVSNVWGSVGMKTERRSFCSASCFSHTGEKKQGDVLKFREEWWTLVKCYDCD